MGREERRQKASLYDGGIGPISREQGERRDSPARLDGWDGMVSWREVRNGAQGWGCWELELGVIYLLLSG